MTAAVDWGLAERIAVRAAGRDPYVGSYHLAALGAELERITPEAERLVEAETGWTSTAGPAHTVVVTRADWVRANLASFRRLLRPLLDRMEQSLAGPAAFIGPRIAAVEFGVVLGWMSTRVLGQYDLLVSDSDLEEAEGATDRAHRGDTVFLVGSNLLELERRHGLPSDQFRMWVTLHELTHRLQFTGVPWIRPWFLDQVATLLGDAEVDPLIFFRVLGRVAEDLRHRRNPLADGVAALFATDAQRAGTERLGGLMSLLEGHGDLVMDRAGADQLPAAPRFAQLLRARRSSGPAAGRVIQQLLGIDAKIRQYQEGEDFLERIEAHSGRAGVNRAFESPETVPTLYDIRHPEAWLHRVGLITPPPARTRRRR